MQQLLEEVRGCEAGMTLACPGARFSQGQLCQPHRNTKNSLKDAQEYQCNIRQVQNHIRILL